MGNDEINLFKKKIDNLIEVEQRSLEFMNKNGDLFIEGKIEGYKELKKWLNNYLINEELKKASEDYLINKNNKISIKEIGLSNKKDVENLIRRNRESLLELEEIIVAKIGEGVNVGVFINDQLIGYALGSYDIVNELYGNKKALDKVNEIIIDDELVFIISDLLVDKKHRNNGYGSLLLKEIIKLNKSNVNLLLGRHESNGNSWKAEKLSEYLGFEKIYREKGFWNNLSIEEDYECLACKLGCHCEMLLTYINKGNLIQLFKDKMLETSN